MRISIILTLLRKELLETLRDRRTLLITLGIPLLLYPLLTLSTAGLTRSTSQRLEGARHKVVLAGGPAPKLQRLLASPKSGLSIVESKKPGSDLASGRIDAVLELSSDFQRAALEGGDPQATIRINRGRRPSVFAEQKVRAVLQSFNQWAIEQRLAARGVPASLLKTVQSKTIDVASGEQRLGSILALLLPMILLITGSLGAFYPAVNATAAERELGTLEALLASPASRTELLAAKALLVFIFAVVTAGFNMLSMALVVWRMLSGVRGGPELGIDPLAMLLAFLAALPTLLWLSAAMLVAGLASRSLREANSYGSLVTLLPMASMFVALGEPETSYALLAAPIVNTTILARDLLRGTALPLHFLIAFGSSVLLAAITLGIASRMMSTESLVNPQWEPFSLNGFRRIRRDRWPAADEALALFGLSSLLLLYIGPAMAGWGFLPMLAGTEILLVLAPAAVMAWLGGYRWREVFLLRPARWIHLVGALLIGLGLPPWVDLLAGWQAAVWAPDPEVARATMRMLLPALQEYPLLTSIALGVLAGICEEAMYRGPILAGFRRGLPVGAALVASSILFAVAHFDAWGAPIRALIGFILGWVALRTGSIWPAVIIHAVYDAAKVGLTAWAVRGRSMEEVMELAADPQAAAGGPLPLPVMLAAGGVMLLTGALLFLRTPAHSDAGNWRPRPPEQPPEKARPARARGTGATDTVTAPGVTPQPDPGPAERESGGPTSF